MQRSTARCLLGNDVLNDVLKVHRSVVDNNDLNTLERLTNVLLGTISNVRGCNCLSGDSNLILSR